MPAFRPKNRFHHPSISYSSLPKNQWVAGALPVSANADGRGFSSIDMNGLQASYNSNKGVLITVPIFLYDPDKGSVPAGRLNVRISRKNNNNSVIIEQ